MRNMPVKKLLVTGAGMSLLVLSLSSASASSANISHSYHVSGSDVRAGSLVSLDPTQTDYVVAANTDNGARLFGIAVANNDSLLEVDASKQTTQVATSGSATTLVSTLNGDINVGDAITVSPFNGVGMKADADLQEHIIGLAQSGFNAHTPGAVKVTATDTSGNKKTVSVGYASVTIGIGTSGTNKDKLTGLQKLVRNITGKTVSVPRVVMSVIVVVIALAALITLTYSAVYGSIVAIGRNPLAKYAIMRTLSGVLSMAALTALVAVFALFLLLH